MVEPLRIAYAGTPQFAVPALVGLQQSCHDVCAVFTQPDRPAGRGKLLQASPVKAFALSADIPVFQPHRIGREEALCLRELRVDLLVVAAYGQLVPKVVLDAPRLGCVNIHASILPRWRGAAPIVHAILSGDARTGVSIMRMDEGLDTGAVLLTGDFALDDRVTQGLLTDRLAGLGAEAIMQMVNRAEFYISKASAQPPHGITYAPKVEKAQALIDWHRSSVDIDRHVRAYNPAPMAYTFFGTSRVRVLSVQAGSGSEAAPGLLPGQIQTICEKGIAVACASGVVYITELQLPGGRPFKIGTCPDRWSWFLASGNAFGAQG